jgi:hypothetical protein
MFFGDVFWGRYVDDWSKASPLKTAYPFSGLGTLQREKYDAWIADLECPITSTYLSSATQDGQLKFSCPVEYTSEAAKWFNAFTLANNHMDNMQEVDGLKQTRSNLDKNGIQYFGHYDNKVKTDICEIVSLPARQIMDDATVEKVQFPIALCGFHNVFKLPLADEMAVITTYSKHFPTFVMPHQGKEYSTKADSLQTSFYRQMIDLGADAVIGDHVHSVQNTEAYNNKLIVYSLGNFIFDQQTSTGVREAFGANLNITFPASKETEAFIGLGKTCKAFQDDCLNIVTSQNVAKPQFSITYDIVPTDNSGKLAKKAGSETTNRVLQITNWAQTAAKLNGSN